jgi:hypothetical protein
MGSLTAAKDSEVEVPFRKSKKAAPARLKVRSIPFGPNQERPRQEAWLPLSFESPNCSGRGRRGPLSHGLPAVGADVAPCGG